MARIHKKTKIQRKQTDSRSFTPSVKDSAEKSMKGIPANLKMEINAAHDRKDHQLRTPSNSLSTEVGESKRSKTDVKINLDEIKEEKSTDENESQTLTPARASIDISDYNQQPVPMTHDTPTTELQDTKDEKSKSAKMDSQKTIETETFRNEDNNEEKEPIKKEKKQKKLSALWNAEDVAEWMIEIDPKLTENEKQSIKNAINEQKWTGEVINEIDATDIEALGIKDNTFIENILKEKTKLQHSESESARKQSLQHVQIQPKDENVIDLEQKTKYETDEIKTSSPVLELDKSSKEKIVEESEQKTNSKSVRKSSIKSKEWDAKKIIKYIMTIDGLPIEYEKWLTNGLNNFNGYNVKQVTKKDIGKWGIKKMKHRKQIYDKLQTLEGTIVPPSTAKAPEIDLNPLKSKKEKDRLKKFHLKLHDTVQLKEKKKGEERRGVILYFGKVEELSGKKLYKFGIELIDNDGKGGEHNGTFNGKEYFQLNNKNGIFVSSDKIINKIL